MTETYKALPDEPTAKAINKHPLGIQFVTTDNARFDTIEDAEDHQKKVQARRELLDAVTETYGNLMKKPDGVNYTRDFFAALWDHDAVAETIARLLVKAIY